ncbi:MAG: flagellar basal body protein [Actinomycetota bacterium]|nr:flagellar basal body protein [Actinomycetota bacterium]
MYDDVTSVALHSALRGLAMRQRTIADNVANINTPRFLAGRVQFEDALREAIAAGEPADVGFAMARSMEPTREDGNNVNLDRETLSNVDTGLRYSLVMRALDAEYGLLRTAMARF